MVATAAGADQAGAQVVPFDFAGEIAFVEPSSPLATNLGLMINDPFNVMAMLDPSFLSGVGPETIELNPNVNAGTSFTLDIGNGALTFTEMEDSGFRAGFPQAQFDDGAFVGFDFNSTAFTVDSTSFEASLFEDDLSIASVDAMRVVLQGSLQDVPSP